jgi:hypothetical protein
LHTMGDKMRINLVNNASVLRTSREELIEHGLLVAEITARTIHPADGKGLMGVHVVIGDDLSPACNQTIEPLCDGGGYNNYDLEVIDRMGADSFQPDHGVMISKTKDSDSRYPFQWTIDANPQDIRLIDFYRANGTVTTDSLLMRSSMLVQDLVASTSTSTKLTGCISTSSAHRAMQMAS